MRHFTLPILLLFLLMQACGHSDPAPSEPSDTPPVSAATLPEIGTVVPEEPLSPGDSARLAALEKAYRSGKNLTSFAPTKEDSLKGWFDEWETVPYKLPFTPDTVDDYLVVHEATRYRYGYLVDGRTGRGIAAVSEFAGDPQELFWNRAYRLDFETVDVNCGDGQKELLVKYAGGHMGSDWYEWLIYRYNPDSLRAEMIASIPLMHFSENYDMRDSIEIELQEWHVDTGPDPGACLNEIRIRDGYKSSNSPENDFPVMLPKKNSAVKTLRFDAAKNRFEEVK